MIGKIIGSIIGFNVGSGFFGLLLGLYLGHQYDRSRRTPWTRSKRSSVNKVFVETLFILLGKISKADGRISRDEIDQVESLITGMRMNTQSRLEAIKFFKMGSQSDRSVNEIMAPFISICGNYKGLKNQLLQCLLILALADNDIHAEERLVLNSVAQTLGISKFRLDQLIQMMIAHSQFHHSSGFQPGDRENINEKLSNAYKILGVSENDSEKTIKTSYRKLISENHPDKLIGQGMPEDLINMATDKTQKIQSAFELIKSNRNI